MEWVGYLVAAVVGLVAWIIKDAYLDRLKDFEKHVDARFTTLGTRMDALEKLATAGVTHAELTSGLKELREELRETRVELTGSVQQLMAQIVELLQKPRP
jgi:hypothetical protein